MALQVGKFFAACTYVRRQPMCACPVGSFRFVLVFCFAQLFILHDDVSQTIKWEICLISCNKPYLSGCRRFYGFISCFLVCSQAMRSLNSFLAASRTPFPPLSPPSATCRALWCDDCVFNAIAFVSVPLVCFWSLLCTFGFETHVLSRVFLVKCVWSPTHAAMAGWKSQKS